MPNSRYCRRRKPSNLRLSPSLIQRRLMFLACAGAVHDDHEHRVCRRRGRNKENLALIAAGDLLSVFQIIERHGEPFLQALIVGS